MIKTREELIALREKAVKMTQAENKRIIVCAGAGCVSKGALKIYDKLLKLMQEKNLPYSVELQEEPHSDNVRFKQSGCHGFCEIGPLVRIEPQGWLYVKVAIEDCEEIIEKTIVGRYYIEYMFFRGQNSV